MADSASSSAGRVEDVVCPFCGLGCDDLAVEVEGDNVRALAPACRGATELFRRTGSRSSGARLAGQPVPLEMAAGRAAELISASRAPLFTGLGADVAGLRAVIGLAEAGGAVVDHYASAGMFRGQATAQRSGWISTTIAEVRNRCDLLLVIGPDPTESYARLFERLLPPDPAFIQSQVRRQVIFLGGEPSQNAIEQLSACDVTVLPSSLNALADLLLLLNRMTEGGRPVTGSAGGVDVARIQELADALRGSRYVVVAVDAGRLPADDADLIVEAGVRLVDQLNRMTRAALLPLGGRDNVIGANQVMLWRVGFPLRTAIRQGAADHDPLLFGGDTALRDCDLMIWVSAFRPEPPPDFEGPVIALSHPDTVFRSPPDVFVPVGTPGIDHDGQVFRMDTVVCLPLKGLRKSDLPSVATVAGAIAKATREAGK